MSECCGADALLGTQRTTCMHARRHEHERTCFQTGTPQPGLGEVGPRSANKPGNATIHARTCVFPRPHARQFFKGVARSRCGIALAIGKN